MIDTNVIHLGDALSILRDLPSDAVQCIITSPPYWGLRDYGVQTQLGLEPDPEEYVDKLTCIMREARRVLRPDGVCWFNIGDSYYNYRPGATDDNRPHAFGGERDIVVGLPSSAPNRKYRIAGLKEKDLCLIPARLSLAFQADGWYVRSRVIWNKPNARPESVGDRPTKAHEDIYLLTKSADYYYDNVAIMEPVVSTDRDIRRMTESPDKLTSKYDGLDDSRYAAGGHSNLGRKQVVGDPTAGRNKRDVWTIATVPFSEAHFASFPTDLIEPMVLASTSECCCSICGAPVARVTEKSGGKRQCRYNHHKVARTQHGGKHTSTLSSIHMATKTVGWSSTCEHDDRTGRCIVLDPFMGAGTVALVAKKWNRQYVGIEINPEYIEIANRRISQEVLPILLNQ